ncbi:MAG: T9SS type A sorting domain-containing protein [Bacteroidetes bacterium]|nr:T9SS type A sorting domain-containing protein [Bacteroidota bacterium]
MKSNQKMPNYFTSVLAFLFPAMFIFFSLIPGISNAQWNTNTSVNILISGIPVADLQAAPTSDGKTWIAFYANTGSNYDMRAQLIDANGYKLLGADGMLVSSYPSGSATFVFNVCVDASNNLIIAYQDMRSGPQQAIVYKISQAGTQLWGSTGVILGGGLAPYPAVLSTGEVVVAWNETATNTLNLQKITTSGTLAWGSPIPIMVGTSTTTRGQLIANNSGKFSLVYQKRGVGISTTLYSLMFDNSGVALYTALQICNQTTSGARYYSIVAEGDTTYFGYYSSTGNRFNSFLQRINPSGTLPWGVNGSNFNTSTGTNDPYQSETAINLTPGSAYVWSVCTFTNPAQTQYGVYIQKFLKTSGARQFTDAGKVVYAISASMDAQWGDLALVNDTPMFESEDVNYKIYATRLDASGNFVWPGNRVELSSTTATMATPKMREEFTPDGPNRCAGTWTENRGTDYMGYAQGISIGGLIGLTVTTLGSVPATITTNGGTLQMVGTVYPASASQSVTWSIVPTTGSATISITGLVTAVADGIVYAKAVSVQDITVKDSLMITITGQVALAPTVTTLAATGVTGTVATLNGSVNANGASTTVTFNWGLTISYGNTVAGTPGTVTGGSPTPVLANLTGLAPVTTYHFRCVGVNSVGTTNGNDLTFTTCQPPAAAGTITGPTTVCQNQSGAIYSVSAIPFATSYTWTVPNGASITAGSGTNTITVSYSSSATSGNVTVTGNNSCSSGSTSTLAVTVNPAPVPTITGPSNTCAGSATYNYTTEASMTNYSWVISAGGSIVSGTGTNSVQVQWNIAGSQTLSVNYSNSTGCQAQTPTIFNVTVSNMPSAAGPITGDSVVCAATSGHLYFVNAIGGAISYLWVLPTGATIASGAGTSVITVDYAFNASSGPISVVGSNACGNGTSSSLNITVNPAPATPVIDSNGFVLTSSASAGNQWYKDGTLIPGATGQQYTVTQDGWYWTVVTTNGCSSAVSNMIYIVVTGIEQLQGQEFRIYPNPNDGRFTIYFASTSLNNCHLEILNILGTKIYELNDIEVNKTAKKEIDLQRAPAGVYTVILKDRNDRVVKQFIINR